MRRRPVSRLSAAAPLYKLYIESEGVENRRRVFTRAKVFEALQLSADPDRVKKEPAPNSGRKPKAKPDEVAPAEEVKVEAEPEVEGGERKTTTW